MNSRVEKVKVELVCARCSRKIQWAWVIEYRSYRLTQYVYVCGQCGSVLKVTNARERPLLSPPEMRVAPSRFV